MKITIDLSELKTFLTGEFDKLRKEIRGKDLRDQDLTDQPIDLIPSAEACQILGNISRPTLKHYVDSGYIKRYGSGHTSKYSKVEVTQYEHQRQKKLKEVIKKGFKR